MKEPFIILAGPTAVGKTGLSVKLAKAAGCEIISADSMQVYRHMDIGSAKIRPEEMEGIPHYLIDCLEPTEEFNVVRFQQMARAAVKEIRGKGRIPLLVGGTGFYIQAVAWDIDFEANPQDTSIRRRLEELAKSQGAEALHQMLAGKDPASAAAIHPHNVKRVIRALEYYEQTGTPISAHNEEQKSHPSPYNLAYFVLNDDRARLYRRIDARVDHMLQQGLVEEVARLKAMGCRRGMVSMQGLGYKEILDYLEGRLSLEDAVYTLKRDTRHFAKRQLTWFKRERMTEWFSWPDYGDDPDRILEAMLDSLRQKGILPNH
ncbi:MAG TPA: tRNA (adenosine(37)-N6)-dimethylallyltransferase MiaA [Candidatus Pullilachnospira intestinigallinarum]|nr:tRNA (adenosine(37)-N6)-dimethylallyltransferase MiaA [Candidatus Pullilachnospira intestinigallinarum]